MRKARLSPTVLASAEHEWVDHQPEFVDKVGLNQPLLPEPFRRNGQPAFGAYLRTPTGVSHGIGLYVLGLTRDRICAMTRFENSVLPWFGIPRSLPR